MPNKLALSLLVFGIFTNYHNPTFALDDPTFGAAALDACSYFHLYFLMIALERLLFVSTIRAQNTKTSIKRCATDLNLYIDFLLHLPPPGAARLAATENCIIGNEFVNGQFGFSGFIRRLLHKLGRTKLEKVFSGWFLSRRFQESPHQPRGAFFGFQHAVTKVWEYETPALAQLR